MDIYRTLAHELVHYKQKEDGKEMNGNDGSEIENEANATAAVLLRQYSQKIPNHGY
jgi:Zn-dependent peptidase ImmA (M78 family)